MIRGAAFLVGAALLEITGVALTRIGLERHALLIACGALLLTAYGLAVNQGGLTFGRLMGVYIAIFFVVSQLVAAVLFHQIPAPRTLIGGALIIGGGLVILT